MEKVESGKYVQVHYTGTLDNGDQFDSSKGRLPLEVQAGAGMLIPGFDRELIGMEMNETKTFRLEASDAYGEKRDDLTRAFARSEIPPGVDPKVGDTVGMMGPGGQQVPAQVVEADEEKVVVDINHPLAGKALTFEIQIVGISDEPTQSSGCGGCSTAGSCGDEGGECGCGGCG